MFTCYQEAIVKLFPELCLDPSKFSTKHTHTWFFLIAHFLSVFVKIEVPKMKEVEKELQCCVKKLFPNQEIVYNSRKESNMLKAQTDW